jgi:hypothetical protein
VKQITQCGNIAVILIGPTSNKFTGQDIGQIIRDREL